MVAVWPVIDVAKFEFTVSFIIGFEDGGVAVRVGVLVWILDVGVTVIYKSIVGIV